MVSATFQEQMIRLLNPGYKFGEICVYKMIASHLRRPMWHNYHAKFTQLITKILKLTDDALKRCIHSRINILISGITRFADWVWRLNQRDHHQTSTRSRLLTSCLSGHRSVFVRATRRRGVQWHYYSTLPRYRLSLSLKSCFMKMKFNFCHFPFVLRT